MLAELFRITTELYPNNKVLSFDKAAQLRFIES